MSQDVLISRRDILRKSLTLSALAAGAAAFGIACSKTQTEIHCDDTTGLPPADIETRKTLAYVDRAADPQKPCNTCQQFVVGPSANACGTCKVLKGSVHPLGGCKSWAAKPT
jgi:hypothetical protein